MLKLTFALSLCVLSTAWAQQDCTKLQPEDLSYLQTLTNIDNHTCKDNVVEVYLTRQFGEILPLKRLEIRKRDLKDKIRIIGTQLQIDGKRYSASDVSIFSYKCDRPNAQWAQAEDNQLRPLGCANPMPRFQAYQSDYRTHEQLFSRFVSPNFQKTNQMCIDRARDQILNNVREYLEKNGGRIVSVKPVPPKSIEDRSDGNHLEWQNFEITVQQGG